MNTSQKIGISPREEKLWHLLEPTVLDCGLKLVCLRLVKRSGLILEVLVDGQNGKVGLEECATCSRRISRMMDVEDPITEAYTLEVSSPGLERPLVTVDDLHAHAGKVVKIKLNGSMEVGPNTMRKLKGTLGSATDKALNLTTEDGHAVEVDLADIEDIHLVPSDDDFKQLLKAPLTK
ncbi:MAG: ribosome maturation factor RimP [Alphaproteobacteria bacterium]